MLGVMQKYVPEELSVLSSTFCSTQLEAETLFRSQIQLKVML